MRERHCSGERNEMRNKQYHKVRERESENVNKKILYVLELCYSAILPLELHCSSIAKKFAILEFRVLDAEHFGAANAKFYLRIIVSY